MNTGAPLRVCMITGFRPTAGGGGTEKHVFELCRGLRERGVDVTVICEDRSFLPDGADDLVARVIGVDSRSVRSRGWVERYREKSRRFAQLLDPAAFDVVHAHSHYGFNTSLKLAGLRGAPALVSTFHLTPVGMLRRFEKLGLPEPAAGPIDRAVAIMEETQAQLSTRCIAVSRGVADEVVEQYGVERERVEVVYNWYDRQIFSPLDRATARQQLGLDPQRPYVLYIGHFRDFRGKLLAQAIRHTDHEISFIAVHPDSDDSVAVELGDRVIFVGYTPPDRLALYYAAADAQCFPTVYGAFGLVLIEGLACGCPAIVFDLPAMNEIVTPECGYLVGEATAEAYARAIEQAVSDGTKKRDAAARRARYFDMESQIDRVHRLYEDTVTARTPLAVTEETILSTA